VSTLDALMTEHRAAAFPESVEKGLDYGEVDAVLIGADIYGWALRASKGDLSRVDRDHLQIARLSLLRSLDAFPNEARPYYEQLVALATEALR
jgi:hypothetical protein